MHKMEVYLTNLHGSRRLNPAGRRPWSRSSLAPPESPDPAASAPLPVPGLARSSPRPPTSTRAAMDGRCVRIDCRRTRASDAYGPASAPPLLLLSSAMCSPPSSGSAAARSHHLSQPASGPPWPPTPSTISRPELSCRFIMGAARRQLRWSTSGRPRIQELIGARRSMLGDRSNGHVTGTRGGRNR